MPEFEHNTRHGIAGAHGIHRWVHANQAARFAESAVADDRGKVSWQTGDNTFWVLRDHTNVANSGGWRELDDVAALAAAATAQSAANAAQASADAHAARHKGDGADPIVAAVITEAGATRTIALADLDDVVRYTAAGGCALTVPLNATLAISVGALTAIVATGAIGVTVTPETGAVIVNAPRGGTLVVPQNGRAVLQKVATNEWDLWGTTVPS